MSINLGEGNKINSQFIIANSGNTYGTNYSYLGVGGFYELSSITERNDIPLDSLKIMNSDGYSSGRRRLQMIVHTLDDGKYWQLLPQLKIGYRAGPSTFIAYSSDTRVSDSLWVTLSNAEKLVLLDPTITVFDSTTNRFYFGSGDANTAWYDTPLQVYITGGTFNSGTSILQLFDTSGNTISVTGITTWPGIDIHVTGFTYSANTLTISNSSGSPFSVTINTMTGLTINGNLIVTGNTNISGNTILNNLSANTISGGTFIGNGSGLTNVQNIYNTDGFLTGNRIVDLSGRTLSFRRTSGFNQTFLNLIDESNNVLTEVRASLTVPVDIDYPNLFIGKNVGVNSTALVRTNLVVGNSSLTAVTSGVKNTVFGNRAFVKLIRGSFNTVIGDTVATNFTGATTGNFGDDNIFIGNGSALNQLTGRFNVYLGTNVREFAISGDNNTIIGKDAGRSNIVGSGNVFLGYRAGRDEIGSNLLYIENSQSATPLIWGDFTNDFLRFNAKVGVNILPSTYQFDVNGTSRFSNTVQLDTVNSATTDTKILTLSSGNIVQYRNLSDFSGGTGGVSGNYLPLSGGTVTGNTIFQSGLTANTISATTYFNLPIDPDTYVTGFTYDDSNTFYIYDNSGTTFDATINYVTGLTVNGVLTITATTGQTFGVINFGNDPFIHNYGTGNTYVGDFAGSFSGNGYDNTGIGEFVLDNLDDGYDNTGLGALALTDLTGGTFNTALGAGSLQNLISGDNNTAVGVASNALLQSGSGNTSFGFESLFNNINGSGNVAIGNKAGYNETGNNKLYIANNDTTTLIYGEFDNQRVGINTTSPTNTLHVSASTDPVRFEGLQLSSDTRVVTTDNNGVLHYIDLSGITGNTIIGDYLPLSGGTVSGDTIFQSGLTATTISATTYFNLPIDPDVYVTGFTYSANTFYIFDNSGTTFDATINDVTGLTVNGNLSVTGDTTLNNLTANTITATTISGGTLYGDGSNLTNIDNIYNVDGSLISNRNLDLNSFDLTISGASSSRFFANGRLAVGTTSDLGNQFVVSSPADPVRFVNMSTITADTFMVTADSNGVLRELGGNVANRIPFFNSSSAITTNQFFTFSNPTTTAILSLPGTNEGATGSQLRLNAGRATLTSTGLGGLDVYVGNGTTGGIIDTTKSINFQNNGRNFLTLIPELNSLTGSTRAAFTSRVSIDTGTTPLARNYWGTTGVAFSVAGRPWVDTTSNGSQTDLAYTSIGIPTFTANSGTNYNGIYTFYIDGPPTLGTNVSGTTYALYVRTGNILFGGLQSNSADTRILTSDSNGLIRYRNFSDFTGGTGSLSGNYLPLSGGTVTGDTIFQSGLTANTISATTYLNLPIDPDTYVTGFTYSANTFYIYDNSGTTFDATINDVTGLTVNGNLNVTGNTILNNITATTISASTYVNLPFNYYITGSTPTGVVLNYGDRWYNTNNGIELVWITDGNSDQWVQPAYNTIPQAYNNVLVTSGITTSSATLSMNVNYYGVNYNGDVDLTLPSPVGYDGYNMNIKDEGGYAGTTRIRITPASGTIDGNPYVDMNINYMSLHVVARNNNWWII